jgi:hypothetical protein
MYISIDEETRQLYVDKRLALGVIFNDFGDQILEVYKITGIDMKSKNFGVGSHLALITLQRDVFDAGADDIPKEICNIILSEDDIPSSNVAGYCDISGKDTIRIGRSRAYPVEFYTANGQAVQGIEAQWNVEAPQGVVVDVSGNECVVNVPLEPNLVGAVIELTVSDAEGLYGILTKKVQVIPVG